MITTCPALRIILYTGLGIRPVVLTGFTFRNPGRPSFNGYPWKNQAYPRITSVYNLHIQETLLQRRGPRRRRTVVYSIPSAQPKRVVAELLAALTTQGIGQDVSDLTAQQCVRCMRELRKRTLRRRKAVVHRVQLQSRANVLT